MGNSASVLALANGQETTFALAGLVGLAAVYWLLSNMRWGNPGLVAPV